MKEDFITFLPFLLYFYPIIKTGLLLAGLN